MVIKTGRKKCSTKNLASIKKLQYNVLPIIATRNQEAEWLLSLSCPKTGSFETTTCVCNVVANSAVSEHHLVLFRSGEHTV